MKAPSLNKIQAVHGQLRKEIRDGVLKEGDRLPADPELAQRFGCSVGTVNKAVALLAHDGLVERRAKRGTLVLSSAKTAVPAGTHLDAYAFIYPSDQHEGIWRIVKGFQEAAHMVRRKVITITTGSDFHREMEYLKRLPEFDVRGAVMYSNVQTPQDQLLVSNMLMKSAYPIVLVGTNFPGLNQPTILHDTCHAAYTMTKHLLDQGLRRIGFFSSARAIEGCHGYLWALRDAGVEPDESRILMLGATHVNLDDPVAEPTELAASYLSQRKELEAVVCGYDFLAMGMIQAAESLGLCVPDDLKVTGIDDLSMSAQFQVPLTTYRVPYEEIGRRAFATLCDVVEGRPVAVSEVRLAGEKVVRRSA